MTLRLVRAGFALVQDLGRFAAASWGVPRGGAFDEWSLRTGNRICGNPDDAAAIEFVVRGPEIVFERDARAVITGAPFAALLDGEPLEPGRPFDAARGSTLSVGGTPWGARGMLCVAGGIDVPPLLGSKGASPRAGLGAMLSAGDRLAVGPDSGRRPIGRIDLAPPGGAARVVAGPQLFGPAALDTLTSSDFRVSTDADRVGIRLDGPSLSGDGPAEIDPEPAVPGAIQIPGDGRAIVLGPDGPVTGGYPKIATVIAADRWIVAQARPGTRLRFELCEPAEARAVYARRMATLDAMIAP